MAVTVSEGLSLNSKCIKMGREAMRRGGFSSRSFKLVVSISCQAVKSVSTSCQANMSLPIYNRHLLT